MLKRIHRQGGLLRVCTATLAVLCATAFSGRDRYGVQILLPGTQPGQVDTAASAELCRMCHAQAVREWAGSMDANAPRDPIFNAFLSITTKYAEPMGLDVGEYCLRCHSGSGWLAGRSHPGSVEKLRGSDLDGVNCDFCHRLMDPLHPDGSASTGGTVTGYGNGMYVVQRTRLPFRGARGVKEPWGPTVADPFYRTSDYCGVCHEQSNPYLSDDPQHTPPHLQVPVERTYSEWKLSYYATRGEAGTCQSCHMKRRPGYATSFRPFRYRLDVSSHDLAGGNTFAPRAIIDAWNGVNKEALLEGMQRSVDLLQTAAALDVRAGREGDSVRCLVRVTNLTGHKLPSGFPEGLRVWISVTGTDRSGHIMFRSGTYDPASGQFLHDPQAKVYEFIAGMTPRQAETLGKPAGPSFLRSFNDTIFYDNRIPPRGFSNEAFRQRRCAPVGYAYSDGQYWDETTYSMSGAVESVSVSLWYQVANKEFMEFLRDENIDNPYDWNNWGQKVYDAWQRYGEPVRISQRTASVNNVAPELTAISSSSTPVEIRLGQNYPNPFNGESTIEFWISEPARVFLTVYDLGGREVSRLVDADLSAGLHVARVESSNLASGLYFYRLSAGTRFISQKFLVIR